jgi:hypothetical protein
MAKVEYREGVEVTEQFEQAMKLLFQTPKTEVEKKQPKRAASRKDKIAEKD